MATPATPTTSAVIAPGLPGGANPALAGVGNQVASRPGAAQVPSPVVTATPPPAPTPAPKTGPVAVSTSQAATQDLTAKKAVVDQHSQNLAAAGAGQKATLYGPNGAAQVVDVGSQAASTLQSQGWGLTSGSYKPPAPPPAPDAAGAKTGTETAPPPAQGTQGTDYASQISDVNAQYRSEMDKLNAQQDQNLSDYLAKANAIQNGTFPLTPDQQAQINGITQQYQQLIEEQKLANKNYEGSVTQAGISAGRNIYAPEVELGNIHAAVSAGLNSIAKLNNDMVQAVTKAKLAYEDQNWSQFNDIYKTLESATKDRQAEIDKLQQMTTDQLTKIQDYKDKQQQMQQAAKAEDFKEKMDNANLDLATKKQTFDQYMATADLSLKEKQFAETKWKDQQDIALRGAQLALDRQKASLDATGGVTALPATATFKDKTNIPGVQKLDNGGLYFDPTQFGTDSTGKAQARQAQAIASEYGIKTLSGKDADSVKQLDASRSAVQEMKNIWDQTAQTGIWNVHGLSTTWNQVMQTPKGNMVTAYGAKKKALQGLIVSLENTGGIPRVQGEVYNNFINSLPDPGILNLQTKANGDTVFDGLMQQLSTNQDDKIGSRNYEDLTQFTQNNPRLPTLRKIQGFTPDVNSPLPPTMQAIDYVKTQFPDASDDDILQYLSNL